MKTIIVFVPELGVSDEEASSLIIQLLSKLDCQHGEVTILNDAETATALVQTATTTKQPKIEPDVCILLDEFCKQISVKIKKKYSRHDTNYALASLISMRELEYNTEVLKLLLSKQKYDPKVIAIANQCLEKHGFTELPVLLQNMQYFLPKL